MLYSGSLPSLNDIHAAVGDAERLEAVQAVRAVVGPNAVFERLSRRASELLGTPLALISLVEADRDIIYGQTGLPQPLADAGCIGAQPSFCQLTITSAEPVVINDAQTVPTLRLFPSVSELGVRAHLGIPLKAGGQPIGNCCVIDFRPRQWTLEDVAHLSELAALALEELAAVKPA